ncbi:N-acetylglucosaminylphosphatidylinositol deacetylase, putative [Eimeria acervulina]|uniref:N-acetylglucosaminylphosphatidylinositol deacetylase n=1 Tax=Eimeria acervulina TaxID=5801 RepID=U6GBC5_EIMAC|nr:N-acetylglucosaminylphosphatidylinositol deacetylase, putative [Eimeria acervulina]CDI77536.1 N-acetylglucosaminylphosphatidylinositol deacetylase, putative [Eimeria acervulina]
MSSSADKNVKAATADEMASARTADTSPVAAAAGAAAAAAGQDAVSSSSNSSSSNSSSNSNSSSRGRSSSRNYGVALGAIGAALSVTLLQYLPRLFSAEGRAAFRAALLQAGGGDWLLVCCCTLFSFGCIGSILYNARLAHNWRLERFIVALVAQQRRQQQLLQQQLQQQQQKQNLKHHQQKAAEREKQQQQQQQHEHHDECCCCEEEEAKIGVLFVTAHPDDECMFFAPSLSLFTSKKERFEVFLLCLSTGDYEGLGATRREELFAAAAALGVSKDNVCCLNDKNMRDGWQQWSSKAVCNAVRGFLKSKQQQIHCIFTFDRQGVSRHPNHVSVYEGLKLLNEEVLETCRQQHEQQLELRKGEVELKHDVREQQLQQQQQQQRQQDGEQQQETDEEQQQELQLLPSVFIFSLQTHCLIRKYCGALNLIPATVEANNKGVCVAAAVAVAVAAAGAATGAVDADAAGGAAVDAAGAAALAAAAGAAAVASAETLQPALHLCLP